MQPHPYFALRLHDDQELRAIVGCAITARVTLHEWPLSCVQRLHLADGRTMIYKSQYGPTVEAAFYRHATASFLISAQTLYAEDGHVALLFDEITAPRLCDLPCSTEQLVAIGQQLAHQISQVAVNFPVYLDLSTIPKWQQIMAATQVHLAQLVADGRFVQTTADHLHALAAQTQDEAVLAALAGPSSLVHGDLTGDNVFVLGDRWRVIDWQRPLIGPSALDLATLLHAAGVDPRPYVAVEILQLRALLQIQWLAACAVQWFPPGCAVYDRMIAELISQQGVDQK